MEDTSIINAPWFYVMATAVFVLIVFLMNKFNRGVIDRGVAKAKAQDMMPELAGKLGLKYEDLSHHKDTKENLMDVGSKIFGEYKGFPIEIVMHMRADQENVPLGYQYAYSYKMDRYIKIGVKNPDKKSFEIIPKNVNVVAKASGKAAFDEKLMITGKANVPGWFLNYCAELGWMNLKFSEGNLSFNDTFYDQFQTGLKGMEMLSVVHPIWKSSASSPQIDVDAVVQFIDKLVKLVEEITKS